MSDRDSGIAVTACGAVSPAGWGVERLVEAVRVGRALPSGVIQGGVLGRSMSVRRVPAPRRARPPSKAASRTTSGLAT